MSIVDEQVAELRECIEEAERALATFDEGALHAANTATLTTATEQLRSGDGLLQQIRLSARSLKRKRRKKFLSGLAAYATTVKELQQLAQQSQDKLNRSALIGRATRGRGGGGGGSGGSSDDDDDSYARGSSDAQLASDGRRLHSASSKLKSSLSRVYETTETAAKTLEDLQIQRETLLSSKEKGQSVIQTASRARRTIGAITRQQMINKIMIYVVIGLVLMVLGIMVYFVLFR